MVKGIGKALRAIRIANDLTSEELGEFVSKGHGCILNWENGRSQPKPTDIVRLCKVLNTDPNTLFGWGLDDVLTPRQINCAIYALLGRFR